ncbi:MAG: NAD-dependent deacylase [Verrucomicrobiae bacterium]|nr:NAD-dependent deacylase [Verrucomicrobiae bacterium]
MLGPRHLFILTGAGISAESGLATFRGAGGLWEGHRVETVASPEGFTADPDLVHRFYNERRRQLHAVSPNPTHRAIARLQREFRGEVTLVTQNVDDLHERGGSPNLIHLHGELLKARCVFCRRIRDWSGDLDTATRCGNCGGNLRPHIVWFGEMPLRLEEVGEALSQCDLFASIGTSGQVYPAAGFVDLAHRAGARCLEFNLEVTPTNPLFHESIVGPAGETVPAWVEDLVSCQDRPET